MNINATVDRFLSGYCTPARIFLILGCMSLLVELVLGVRTTGHCVFGSMVVEGGADGAADTKRNLLCISAAARWIVLLVQAAFIFGWTWLIQYLCSSSSASTTTPGQMGAWLLLLLPFLTSVFRVL